MPPSDTFFTTAPGWEWLVILYFFFGGLAGGSFALAALVDLFGRPIDWPLARLGYIIAFVTLLPCPILLSADLTRPERFWHMLIASERAPAPIFKLWSPMSVGSWALLLFGLFSFLAFLGAVGSRGPLGVLRRDPLRWLIVLLGAAFGFFVASYTGVLLSVTNRPIWADTPLLGLLFLASGASTAAALMLLLGRPRGWVAPASLARLERLDTWVTILELVVLIAMVLSLGPLMSIWLSIWGLLLAVGVLLVGILLPLALHWGARQLGGASIAAASVLALIGGFILRAVIVLSSESL